MDRFGDVVGKGVMKTPVKLIHRIFISKDASHFREGEVVRRLHSFIVIVVEILVFQVSVLAGNWGGTLQKLVPENITAGALRGTLL